MVIKSFLTVGVTYNGPAPGESVADWVERKFAEIRKRYVGMPFTSRIKDEIYAATESVARRAEWMTGIKPEYSIDIKPHCAFIETYGQRALRKDYEREMENRRLKRNSDVYFKRQSDLREQALAKLTPEEILALNLD